MRREGAGLDALTAEWQGGHVAIGHGRTPQHPALSIGPQLDIAAFNGHASPRGKGAAGRAPRHPAGDASGVASAMAPL